MINDKLQLDVDDHGGGCCGILHLHNFPYDSEGTRYQLAFKPTEEERQTFIKQGIEKCLDEFDNGCGDPDCEECSGRSQSSCRCAIEVVITEHQTKTWRKALEAVGFKEVFNFLNSNTGNRCHVFFLETNA